MPNCKSAAGSGLPGRCVAKQMCSAAAWAGAAEKKNIGAVEAPMFLYGESPAEGSGLLYCERMKKFRNIRKCGSDCRRVLPVRSNEQQAAADRKRVKGVNLTEQVLDILFF